MRTCPTGLIHDLKNTTIFLGSLLSLFYRAATFPFPLSVILNILFSSFTDVLVKTFTKRITRSTLYPLRITYFLVWHLYITIKPFHNRSYPCISSSVVSFTVFSFLWNFISTICSLFFRYRVIYIIYRVRNYIQAERMRF